MGDGRVRPTRTSSRRCAGRIAIDPDVRGLKADNPFARLGLIDEDTRLALVHNAHAS